MFLGAVLGAGFATGQEVLQYFARFGPSGLLGVTCVILLLWLLCRGVLSLSRNRAYPDLYAFLQTCCGPRLGALLHGIFVAFLFVVFGVMGSSLGALSQEAWGWQPVWGFALYVVGMMALLLRGERGVTALFSVLTPMMAVGIVLLCLYALLTRDVAVFAGPAGLAQETGGALASAVLYFGYNSIIGVSVLCTLAAQRGNPRWTARVALLSAGGFGLCLLVLYGALWAFYGQVAGLEIPVLYLASLGGERMVRLYTVVALCAILTTGAGCGYVLDRSMGRSRLGLFVLCSGSVVFGACDFSFLVRYLYGLFGVLGLLLCGAVALRAIRERR